MEDSRPYATRISFTLNWDEAEAELASGAQIFVQQSWARGSNADASDPMQPTEWRLGHQVGDNTLAWIRFSERLQKEGFELHVTATSGLEFYKGQGSALDFLSANQDLLYNIDPTMS